MGLTSAYLLPILDNLEHKVACMIINITCNLLSRLIFSILKFCALVVITRSYEVLQSLEKHKDKREGPIYYYVFNSLLICLLVLHIYWWVLIFRMLVKQIQARGKLGEDVRSGLYTYI